MRRDLLLGTLAVLGAGCFDPRAVPPGAVACDVDHPCPGTWTCTAEGRCADRTADGGGDPDLFYGEFAARKRLTISDGRVLEPLDHFPVLVDLAVDVDLAAIARPDGSDLAFFAADGTRLAHEHELELYDEAGRLVAWVNVPRVERDTATSFYLAFGAAAGAREDGPGTFDGHAGVWHLGASPGATAVRDSTVHDTAGFVVGDVVLGREGLVGRGASFARTGRIQVSDPVDGHLDFDPTRSLTYSLWVRWIDPRPVDWQVFLYKGATNPTEPGYSFELGRDDDVLSACVSDAVVTRPCVNEAILPNTWVHLAGVVDRSAATFTFFMDATPLGTMPIGGLDLSSTLDLTFGAKASGDNPFGGDLDEVRIAPRALSRAWLQAEVANQRDPATFVDVGPLERAPAP